MNILFASETEKAEFWVPLLEQALPKDRFLSAPGAEIDIAIVATPPAGTLGRLKNVKLIQSLWMGVEKLLADPGLPKGVPLARLIDPGMVAAMSESVLAHVLDWHRHHYRYRAQQGERQWRRRKQYLASDRTVGILGLGELGGDAARKLLALGFNVAGYSRRPKQLAGVQCRR
jgi:glyoxylate/hydroxypyruvate reductase A